MDLNVRATYKTLRRKVGVNLDDLGSSNGFLDMTQKRKNR